MNNESSSQDLSTPLLPSYQDQAVPLQDLPASNSLDHDESRSSTPSCEAHHLHEPHAIDGRVTALTLAMIIFYNVTGGPFGIESSVKAAGNLYAIIGITLMPLVWAIPEMYMTYRLSTLYPCASGVRSSSVFRINHLLLYTHYLTCSFATFREFFGLRRLLVQRWV
jgi:hypothetical protein